MGGFVRTCDENVIYVGEAVGNATEDFINKALESLCSIPETEWHPDVLEQAEGHDDSGLRHVIRMNWNLMEGFDEVDS